MLLPTTFHSSSPHELNVTALRLTRATDLGLGLNPSLRNILCLYDTGATDFGNSHQPAWCCCEAQSRGRTKFSSRQGRLAETKIKCILFLFYSWLALFVCSWTMVYRVCISVSHWQTWIYITINLNSVIHIRPWLPQWSAGCKHLSSLVNTY